MRVTDDGSDVDYVCDRRRPEPTPARSYVSIEIGAPYAAAELTERDHFLTARWTLFSSSRLFGLRYADAEHAPWPLRRATVRDLQDELVTAAGLPAPEGHRWCTSPKVSTCGSDRRTACALVDATLRRT